MERRFYAMRLWYEGSRFRGFQRQPGLPTVQDALEEALRRAGICTHLFAAARTDAGVHALDQVVSFAVRATLDPSALRRALNAALPDGIAVVDAWEAPAPFHARACARSRTYVYLVGTDVPAAAGPYAWSLPDPRAFPDLAHPAPDPARILAALSHAVGTHDFAGFARGTPSGGTTRTLLRADVHSASWTPLHALVLEGTGFLRAMVRNLVGTAVTCGVGLAPPSRVAELLAARGRYRGVRAPAHGLTLSAIAYPGEG